MFVSSLIVLVNPLHKADVAINSPSNFSRIGVHLVEEISWIIIQYAFIDNLVGSLSL